MNKFIPVNEPIFTGNEKKYLNECIDTGWVGSDGPFVEKFEESLAKYCNREYVSLVSNGSAALEIAFKALNIRDGDEIIMPSHTIISCAAAITKLGALPVLIDSDETWNMNVDLIEQKITNKTKAILAVHTYGFPVDMDKVISLANKHNLYVVEDAAEMIGQKYKDKECGSMGDISIFSFYPNKHITTGEGGACLTNNKDLIDRCNYYKNLCFEVPRFVHTDIGWNYRFSNVQAAIGLAQLEKLEEHIEKKRKIGYRYTELLSNNDNFTLQPVKLGYAENIWWVFGILITNTSSQNARNVIDILSNRNIGSRPFFYPIHKQPVYKNIKSFQEIKHPVSENLAQNGFYIPSGLALTEEDIEIVAAEVNAIF